MLLLYHDFLRKTRFRYRETPLLQAEAVSLPPGGQDYFFAVRLPGLTNDRGCVIFVVRIVICYLLFLTRSSIADRSADSKTFPAVGHAFAADSLAGMPAFEIIWEVFS